MMKHKVAARLASVAAVSAVVVGGTVALAPTASAVGSSACTKNVANYDTQTDTTVKFRTGPGTGYTAKGTVGEGRWVYVTCTAKGGAWAFLKVTSGPHKGETGWIADKYLAVPMQTS
ncbi:SH3 domain-containing protein [Streptomyces sp. BA2]|uniref:SH3 domain-containing protein n=1 Tax=Streptomyces sp. BA2 TaxID=436595 RepID=UPI001328AD8B|nr:SH3 domain-containing protein [Streptomyces sp. BA2]MWA15931.1 SH3 domain-containing protein [Streptomyces sp. BA2]